MLDWTCCPCVYGLSQRSKEAEDGFLFDCVYLLLFAMLYSGVLRTCKNEKAEKQLAFGMQPSVLCLGRNCLSAFDDSVYRCQLVNRKKS